MGVDGEGEVTFAQVPHSPQCRVLGAQELAEVFVEHEYQLGHTCNNKLNRQTHIQGEQKQAK